jgi:uncharacterized membrane protein YvbJ
MSRYCSNCGALNDDSAQFCERCGHKLDHSENVEDQHIDKQISKDKASIGYNILGFLFPIVGFILFIVWLKKTPNRAKSILWWSGAGFVISYFALSNA